MNDEQERDAEVAAAERTRSDQIVNAVLRARDDLLKVWHAARRVDGRDIDTPLTEAIHAVCNALFYAAEMPTIVHKDGENEEIGRHILRIKALEYHLRAEKAETERDAVIERWGAMVDIAPDYLRGQEPATAMRGLIAERNAARAELAKLREHLTELADENIRIDQEHVSVGSDQDDLWASVWGAAGRELREALESEADHE